MPASNNETVIDLVQTSRQRAHSRILELTVLCSVLGFPFLASCHELFLELLLSLGSAFLVPFMVWHMCIFYRRYYTVELLWAF